MTTSRRRKTAGRRLREQLDAALVRTGKERGVTLEWDERELVNLDASASAADAAELLGERLAAPDLDAGTAVRLSAERRLLLKAVADHTAALGIWDEKPKSERHVRAGQARWQSWHAKNFDLGGNAG